MKIGYQGIKGSNSERASRILSEELKLNDIELVPLTISENVVRELKLKNIDYGVMAIENTVGGPVLETRKALLDANVAVLEEVVLEIHHCLFKKSGVNVKNIKNIASHIQALIQCKKNIEKLFPNCKIIETEDTSIAAKYLKEGILSDNTAIICSKSAGDMYNLELVKENIEDSSNNYTTFGIYKLIQE